MKELTKTRWSRFCGDMTSRYRFAGTNIVRTDPDGTETLACGTAPLLGISLARKRGKISAFEASLGEIRNGSPAVLLVMLGAPVKIKHWSSDGDAMENIEIRNEDDYRMTLRISGHSIAETYNSLVNQMAYSLAEARNFVPGHEKQDWFLAERLIRKMLSPANDKQVVEC